MKLEIPVFNTESAEVAIKAGADRLEVCSGFEAGGTTPGPGIVSYLRPETRIPLFVMIRPRSGDFIYTRGEIEVMKRDIHSFASMGADGFVFGVLTPEGNVNMADCKELVKEAGGLPCTFHRAFDLSHDFQRSLNEIIGCGFRRILTSGGHNNAGDGLEVIIELQGLAQGRIILIPGGGLKPEMIPALAETGSFKEIHASCKTFRKSKASRPGIKSFLDETGSLEAGIPVVDPLKVKEFRDVISRLTDSE